MVFSLLTRASLSAPVTPSLELWSSQLSRILDVGVSLSLPFVESLLVGSSWHPVSVYAAFECFRRALENFWKASRKSALRLARASGVCRIWDYRQSYPLPIFGNSDQERLDSLSCLRGVEVLGFVLGAEATDCGHCLHRPVEQLRIHWTWQADSGAFSIYRP